MPDSIEIRDRIAALDGSIVCVDRHNKLLDDIEQIHHGFLRSREAARPGASAPCMFVIGRAGSGKSTALGTYRRKFPAEEDRIVDGHVTRRRVLNVEVPALLSVRALVAELIRKIDGQLPQGRAPATELTERFLRLAAATGLELLLLDEAHRLGEYDSGERISNWIVQILNRNQFGVVVAGLPGVEEVCIADNQLSRRVDRTVHLHPYDWRVRADRTEFKGLVTSLLEIVGFKPPSPSDDSMFMIYNWTGGLVGHVRSLIDSVGAAALRQRTKEITVEMLAAWADTHRPVGRTDWENPFRVPREGPVDPGSGFASVLRLPDRHRRKA